LLENFVKIVRGIPLEWLKHSCHGWFH